MTPLLIVLSVLGALAFLFLINLPKLIVICAPNEVLIISGTRRRQGGRSYGYRLVKGGKAYRWPLLERVDRMDLTNMVIDVTAQNAYSKGGVPLTVQGVANVKVAGHEPLLNNAVERFLGKGKAELMEIAKATLEGSLRGILATLTPEQVNEDKILFAERLVQEVEQDMTNLGLVVDTLKIQNVSDEVRYLDSIGRKRSAEIVSQARIAEAKAHADAVVRSAENLFAEVQAQVTAQIEIAKADAGRRLQDTLTKRSAMVAEELAAVAAATAQAKAEVAVQEARIEQVRQRLEADVVQPAKAACEAAEAQARASVAHIVEDGKAQADAMRELAQSWKEVGASAREIFLLQKLRPIIEQLTQVIAATPVEKVTMIGSAGTDQSLPAKLLPVVEQIKEIFGVDLVEKIKNLPAPTSGSPPAPAPSEPLGDGHSSHADAPEDV
jgi:flotillin